jgi:RNA ligase
MAVTIHISPRFPGLVGKKYSPMTPVLQDWDTESLTSRGCVLCGDKYVARPFEKFFNFEELFDAEGQPTKLHSILLQHKDNPRLYPAMTAPYRVMDKLDGSLGIAFFWQGEWFVKTGGSFDSPEALWGTEWLRRNLHTDCMDTACTYCFEIIWLNDKYSHPLTRFYEKDELVLIAVIDNATGKEHEDLKPEAEKIGARVADIYEFDSLTKLYAFAKALPITKEGVVVTFASGFKVKIKGTQFLELQKKFHNITKGFVIGNLSGGIFKPEFRATIPEELKDITDYMDYLETDYCGMLAMVENLVIMGRKFTERKVAYAFFANELKDCTTPFVSYAMNRWSNKYPKNYCKGFDESYRKYALAKLQKK